MLLCTTAIIKEMATDIHPQALVDSKSELEDGVTVGPYAIIGPNVKIGRFSEVGSFCNITGYTRIGEKCKIFSHSVIGSYPQDLKYNGEKSYIVIGNNNTIREFVTINPGTEEGSETVIGSDNLIMAYSHIAHNCRVGSANIFANLATLAGYVEVGDKVVIGGGAAIHQFCRIGNFSIIGGCSKVVQDVPPFALCDGHPAKVRGLNLVGLRRANFNKDTIRTLRKAFKLLFFREHTLDYATKEIKKSLPSLQELDYLVRFVTNSKRGISR